MATIVCGSERIEVPDDDPRIRAYDALNIAATKIGRAGYNTSQEIKDLQEAMPDVLEGIITPEEAMAMLHYGGTGYLLEQARKAQP